MSASAPQEHFGPGRQATSMHFLWRKDANHSSRVKTITSRTVTTFSRKNIFATGVTAVAVDAGIVPTPRRTRRIAAKHHRPGRISREQKVILFFLEYNTFWSRRIFSDQQVYLGLSD